MEYNNRVSRMNRGEFKDPPMIDYKELEVAQFVQTIDYVCEQTKFTPEGIDKMYLGEFMEVLNHAENKALQKKRHYDNRKNSTKSRKRK